MTHPFLEARLCILRPEAFFFFFFFFAFPSSHSASDELVTSQKGVEAQLVVIVILSLSSYPFFDH